MKCPKCAYLGFDTGERCKNCGYEFSLLAEGAFEPGGLDASGARRDVDPDLAIRIDDLAKESVDLSLHDLDDGLLHAADRLGLDSLDGASLEAPMNGQSQSPAVVEVGQPHEKPAAVPRRHSAEPGLPLFIRDADDDTPLITVAPAPRAPLAVRRAPDVPRLRAVSRVRAAEPVLDFRSKPDEPKPVELPAHETGGKDGMAGDARLSATAGRRLTAAAIDQVILLGIDLMVLYFTVRMAALTLPEWRLLPPLPIGLFLGLMKCAYFSAFTAVGGQTIGKMALGIRVVTDDHRTVDPATACRRTLGGVLTVITAGIAYLPALVGSDGRALHDRFAGTRVIALPSA